MNVNYATHYLSKDGTIKCFNSLNNDPSDLADEIKRIDATVETLSKTVDGKFDKTLNPPLTSQYRIKNGRETYDHTQDYTDLYTYLNDLTIDLYGFTKHLAEARLDIDTLEEQIGKDEGENDTNLDDIESRLASNQSNIAANRLAVSENRALINSLQSKVTVDQQTIMQLEKDNIRLQANVTLLQNTVDELTAKLNDVYERTKNYNMGYVLFAQDNVAADGINLTQFIKKVAPQLVVTNCASSVDYWSSAGGTVEQIDDEMNMKWENYSDDVGQTTSIASAVQDLYHTDTTLMSRVGQHDITAQDNQNRISTLEQLATDNQLYKNSEGVNLANKVTTAFNALSHHELWSTDIQAIPKIRQVVSSIGDLKSRVDALES